MLKFYHILLLTLVAVFIASAASIARYAADSCTQGRKIPHNPSGIFLLNITSVGFTVPTVLGQPSHQV